MSLGTYMPSKVGKYLKIKIKTYFLGTEGGAVGDYFAKALLVANHFTICGAKHINVLK